MKQPFPPGSGGAAGGRRKRRLLGRSGAVRWSRTYVGDAERGRAPLHADPRERDDAAMVERMAGYFAASFRQLDPETRRRAIAAVTPAETIAVVVHAAPDIGLPAESARARALARGAQRKQELLVRAGGVLSSGEVAAVLGGISVQAVKARVARRRLLALPLAGGFLGFPAIQFDGTDVRPGLAEVLAAAQRREMGAWFLFALLMDPAPGRDEPVVLALDDARVRAGFLARMETYGEQTAS